MLFALLCEFHAHQNNESLLETLSEEAEAPKETFLIWVFVLSCTHVNCVIVTKK